MKDYARMSPRQAEEYFIDQQKKIGELEKQLKQLIDRHKAETKDYYGVTIGEPVSVIQLSAIIRKIKNDKRD